MIGGIFGVMGVLGLYLGRFFGFWVSLLLLCFEMFFDNFFLFLRVLLFCFYGNFLVLVFDFLFFVVNFFLVVFIVFRFLLFLFMEYMVGRKIIIRCCF